MRFDTVHNATTRAELVPATRLRSEAGFRDELSLGWRELTARFRSAPSRILRSNELLRAAVGSRDVCRVRAGWACQFRHLSNGRRAIIDVYLPGDVIGLDAVFQTRLPDEILTLTSVTIEAIRTENAVIDLMTSRPIALYITWLLAKRQRRADRHLAASHLDARCRLSTMVLDFYTRLLRRRLIAEPRYNLPLTQIQIGNYLGLTEVHVARVLRSLRDEQTLQVEKHSVTILDLDRLIAFGRGRQGNSNLNRAQR